VVKFGKLVLFGVAIAMASVVIGAACGGDGDDSDNGAVATPDASGVIEVTAGDFTFEPSRIVVPAGETVTLRLKNVDTQDHDLQVGTIDVQILEGGATGAEHQMSTPMEGMETPEMMETAGTGEADMGPIALHTTAGGEDSISFIATEKGTYDVLCTMAGHKDEGMVGTLVVE